MYPRFNLLQMIILLLGLVVLASGSIYAQPVEAPPQGCPVGGYTVISCPVVSDEVIQQAVKLRLSGALDEPVSAVNVYVNEGVVTLTGQVESTTSIDLAGIVASSIRGVFSVNNYLELSPQALADRQLISRVINTLREQTVSDIQAVRVDVSQGIVRLTGIVDSEAVREHLELIVLSIDGVEAVQNNLTVRSSARGIGAF